MVKMLANSSWVIASYRPKMPFTYFIDSTQNSKLHNRKIQKNSEKMFINFFQKYRVPSDLGIERDRGGERPIVEIS